MEIKRSQPDLTEPAPVQPVFVTELDLVLGPHNASITALVDLPMFDEKRCVARLVFSVDTAEKLYLDLWKALREAKRHPLPPIIPPPECQ